MNQSVLKALSILELFTEEKELSLQEITDKAEIPKPTAYRLLSTLVSCGMLYKQKTSTHDSRYGLGLKLLEYGTLVSERLELREIALPFMERLAEEVNEVVHLVISDQLEATYIEKVNSKRALSLHTKVGRSTPLYVGSGPKLLLAFLSKDEQEKVLLEQNLVTLMNEPIDIEELLEELSQIRIDKFAVSVGEQDADTTGVSFPIFNYDGKVVAALAVSGLSSLFTGKRLKRIKEIGIKITLEISSELGYREKVEW